MSTKRLASFRELLDAITTCYGSTLRHQRPIQRKKRNAESVVLPPVSRRWGRGNPRTCSVDPCPVADTPDGSGRPERCGSTPALVPVAASIDIDLRASFFFYWNSDSRYFIVREPPVFFSSKSIPSPFPYHSERRRFCFVLRLFYSEKVKYRMVMRACISK